MICMSIDRASCRSDPIVTQASPPKFKILSERLHERIKKTTPEGGVAKGKERKKE